MHIYTYIYYTYIHIYGYVCIQAYIESITMNKASGGDGIAFELFQILKDDVIKAVATGWEKLGFTLVPKKGNANNVQTIALISHTSKVMLKIFQTRLQQYVNQKLPDVQPGFRKGKLPTSIGS